MYDLRCAIRGGVVLPWEITVTAGVPAITLGKAYLTVADGAAGVYAVSLNGSLAFTSGRTLIHAGQPAAKAAAGASLNSQIVLNSTSAFTVETSDEAGTLTEATVISGVLIFFTITQPE